MMKNFEKVQSIIKESFIKGREDLCVVLENKRLNIFGFGCPHARKDVDCATCREKIVQWLKEESE